jgi:hypothetical protein
MSSFATVATVAFAIFFAAVAITMVLPEMSSDTLVWYFIPNNSLNPAGRVQLFYLHPNNADIAALMFSTLPTLALINVLLSFRTHLAKILIILTWIVSLFILEEIFFIELLHPELFVAVLVLSTMYLLAFLRIPLVIKIAFLLIGRMMVICFRTFRFASRLIVKIMFYSIIAPMVLQMLVEELLRMISNSNLPTFGLIVYVGSSFALLSFSIGKKLSQLALCVFDGITDAIASWIVHLPPAANTVAASDDIALPPPATQEEETPVAPRSPQQTVGHPQNVTVHRRQPAKGVSWSDGPFVDTRFRPYYQSGHTISSRLFTENKSDRRLLEKHACEFGSVMDELVGLVSGVRFVPLQEEGRCDWRAIRAVVDDNYAMLWNAQGACRDLVSVYNRFKRDHPHRFRSWSDYQKRLTECKLFEQGIDMLLLEMKLLAEFEPSRALRIVRETWEDAAYDDMEEIKEAAVEPIREEADARPLVKVEVNEVAEVVAVEEPINFDQLDVAEEEEETHRVEEFVEFAPQEETVDEVQFNDVGQVPTDPVVLRSRRTSLQREAAALSCDLGTYWSEASPRRLRRSTRARKQPDRFIPSF